LAVAESGLARGLEREASDGRQPRGETAGETLVIGLAGGADRFFGQADVGGIAGDAFGADAFTGDTFGADVAQTAAAVDADDGDLFRSAQSAFAVDVATGLAVLADVQAGESCGALRLVIADVAFGDVPISLEGAEELVEPVGDARDVKIVALHEVDLAARDD